LMKAVLSEGTNLSLGMINKYLKFTTMQQTPVSSTIKPELVRRFIISMFDPAVDSDIPNVYQMFSFMEQNQYEEEALDGLWIPVKFASPISGAAITDAVDYIEHYEPVVDPIEEEMEEVEYESIEGAKEEMDKLLGDTKWMLTKSLIQTEQIEEYLQQYEQASMEQVIIEATSEKWADAVNALTAISALIGNKRLNILPPDETIEEKKYGKEWSWMNPEDGKAIITKKNRGEGEHNGSDGES